MTLEEIANQYKIIKHDDTLKLYSKDLNALCFNDVALPYLTSVKMVQPNQETFQVVLNDKIITDISDLVKEVDNYLSTFTLHPSLFEPTLSGLLQIRSIISYYLGVKLGFTKEVEYFSLDTHECTWTKALCNIMPNYHLIKFKVYLYGVANNNEELRNGNIQLIIGENKYLKMYFSNYQEAIAAINQLILIVKAFALNTFVELDTKMDLSFKTESLIICSDNSTFNKPTYKNYSKTILENVKYICDFMDLHYDLCTTDR